MRPEWIGTYLVFGRKKGVVSKETTVRAWNREEAKVYLELWLQGQGGALGGITGVFAA